MDESIRIVQVGLVTIQKSLQSSNGIQANEKEAEKLLRLDNQLSRYTAGILLSVFFLSCLTFLNVSTMLIWVAPMLASGWSSSCLGVDRSSFSASLIKREILTPRFAFAVDRCVGTAFRTTCDGSFSFCSAALAASLLLRSRTSARLQAPQHAIYVSKAIPW